MRHRIMTQILSWSGPCVRENLPFYGGCGEDESCADAPMHQPNDAKVAPMSSEVSILRISDDRAFSGSRPSDVGNGFVWQGGAASI